MKLFHFTLLIKKIHKLTVLSLSVWMLIGSHAPISWADQKAFDHSKFDQVLKEFVNDEGLVDYAGLKANRKLLDEYLEAIAAIDQQTLEGQWPREEKLALWLNAYHAAVLFVLSENYPVQSIQDIANVWDTQWIRVAGASYSLNELHEERLMQAFHDEKIQVVLACGAISCPKLKPDAFSGPRVDGQLFLAAREFVNDPNYHDITPGKKKIYLSRLYRWYGDDFKLNFGNFDNPMGFSDIEYSILSFIAHYLEDTEKLAFLEEGNYKVKYLPFDWTLNDWKKDASLETA